MTPEEILNKAIDVINERGWCQNEIESPEGMVCAMGALGVAAFGRCSGITLKDLNDSDAHREAIRMLNEAIYQHADLHLYVADFNDWETTTKEDVILMMKRAASHDS